MKVSELIKRLEKCNSDCEVYFEETQTKDEDGITVGQYTIVDEVYEVGVRGENEEKFNTVRVILSSEEDKEE